MATTDNTPTAAKTPVHIHAQHIRVALEELGYCIRDYGRLIVMSDERMIASTLHGDVAVGLEKIAYRIRYGTLDGFHSSNYTPHGFVPHAYDGAPHVDPCLIKKKPDEPMFVVLGRDPIGHMLLTRWCELRVEAINNGALPDNNQERDHIADVAKIADNFLSYYSRQFNYVPVSILKQQPLDHEVEGEWDEHGHLTIFPPYYQNWRRVWSVLQLVSSQATEQLVESLSDEQRKQAAEWAISEYYSASDNEDVIVPPRPEFLK